MVKGRVFALNTDKFARDICARVYARNYGADSRQRTTIEPLAARFWLLKRRRKRREEKEEENLLPNLQSLKS
jgi:hypothetical protein